MNAADLMREALREAESALKRGEMPVGCVIARKGEIIARAGNEREALHDATAHAEMLAIRRACDTLHSWRLEGCDLFVTLEPCPMCAGAISQARLKTLTFGAADPAYGCAGSVYRIPEDPAFNYFCRITGGVMEDECEEMIRAFFREKRRDSEGNAKCINNR